MEMMKAGRLGAKKLIVFDLDGTLAPSKGKIDAETAGLLARLLAVRKVAVIGGGKYSLFRSQLAEAFARIPKPLLPRLFLFPTTSTAFYRYDKGWKNIYKLALSKRERARIKKAFREVFREAGYRGPEKVYGKTIEDRGTQVTFSALGQEVVARLGKRGFKMKDEWRKKYAPLKIKMAKLLARRLPGLEVRAAGYTSIDVTKKGIDKAYGIRQIEKYLRIPARDMAFVGDALFPGGNDYAARRTGADCVAVRGPADTKSIIKKILTGAGAEDMMSSRQAHAGISQQLSRNKDDRGRGRAKHRGFHAHGTRAALPGDDRNRLRTPAR